MSSPNHSLALEPCLLDESSDEILDLLASLSGSAARLGTRLHPTTAANLADLVRIMNCYYSNLIEGHNTAPRDIERAMANELDEAADRRNLQIEARAHVRVQREIDRRYAAGNLPEPGSIAFIRDLHRDFYADAAEATLLIGESALYGTEGTRRARPARFAREYRRTRFGNSERAGLAALPA